MPEKHWCPFAVKKEMPFAHRLPTRIQCAMIILHTNGGGTGPNGDLSGYFSRPGNDICSHFQVAKDGKIFQYVGIDREAYAEFAGNRYGVSIETEDDGHPEHKWTPAQVKSIIRLAKWLDVPAKVAMDGPSKGVGWHSEYADWNQSAHACPGSVRIAQIHTDIIPGIKKEGRHPHPMKPHKPRLLHFKTPLMKGHDVKELQKALNLHGRHVRGIAEDGIFGRYTEKALKEFQKSKRIKVTGKLDAPTRKALGL